MRNRLDPVILLLCISAFILLVFSFFSPYIFTRTASYSNLNFTGTGQIGDTIGGIMNPFIALVGVLITFLAFYIQMRANRIQIDQFNLSQVRQNELISEQLFFKLVDNLNQRIVNLSFSIDSYDSSSELTSYKAVDSIVDSLLKNMKGGLVGLGRQVLAKYPEKVSIIQYRKIMEANILAEFAREEDVIKLRDEIMSLDDFNARLEYIKDYVGGSNSLDEPKNKILDSIASVTFYDLPFDDRVSLYIDAYYQVYNQYGTFLDGYMKNMNYLLEFVRDSDRQDFFLSYLKSSLSTQELILLYYYCSSEKSTLGFKQLIQQFSLLEGLHLARNRFVDVPSQEILENEIQLILNRFY